MSLNAQVSAERVHIGFFGLRNAGKSSLVNRVTGQELSVVSEVRGTTTDPVRKAMELLPLGPVVIIDTPGLDDEGTLGEERVRRARRVLDQTDIAVLVVDAAAGLSQAGDGSLYFVEKVAFQEPYRLVKLRNRIELNDYLMERYDTSWDQDTARPFIMENDSLMEGYRTVPTAAD